MFKKLLFLYFFIFFLCLNQSDALDKAYCKCRSKTSSRIVGGLVSKPNAFPWQVSLGILPDTPWELRPDKFRVGKRENVPDSIKIATHICGGAIISESMVLTAAHCVTDDLMNPKNASELAVGFGNKHNLIDIYNHGRIQVNKIYVHPEYNVSNTDTTNDVAILKLSQPLNFDSESVRPACLLQEKNENGHKKDYKQLVTTGWGSVNVMNFDFINRVWSGYKASKQLKEATFVDVSNKSSTCKANPKLICAGLATKKNPTTNTSVCKGDSGGPLHFTDERGFYTFLVGITSFGSTKRTGVFSIQACNGDAGYTRLQSVLDWIKSIVSNNMCLFEEYENTFKFI